MNTLKLFILYLLLITQSYAEQPEVKLSVKGKDYHIAIYQSTAVIKRLTDGKKKKIERLLWGESPMFRQPSDFFESESNMAIFLMENYQYWIVNIDTLFKGEEKQQVYEIIEGAVYTPGVGQDRSNNCWAIDGIYPNKTLKGSGFAGEELDKGVDFTLFLSGEKAYTLETTNKDAPRIIKVRAIDYRGTTERHFRYVFQ